MNKKRVKKNNRKSFLFPITALFSLAICIVFALLVVGGEETIYYLTQMNFIPDKKTVCIDPGHGGTSSGATLGSRYEKDDTLRLSLLVRDILKDRGYTVVMTRDDDSDVSLEDRCKTANKERASLFVSIHRNSSSSPSATGVEMWVHSAKPTDDTLLAQNILDCFDTLDIMKNRGIYSGYRDGADLNYYINRHTKMPSVLAEIGFISNKTDNKKYDENIEEYAKAIADGIEMTLKEMYSE
ncbi:MAG: N-acetylmuramoyl-L-alanine amidase [Clostridia bacterium]|nr:N-acetylmuramoyl-L-alanine amidase [Clostridia bacterium]